MLRSSLLLFSVRFIKDRSFLPQPLLELPSACRPPSCTLFTSSRPSLLLAPHPVTVLCVMILGGCLNVCAYQGSPSQHLPLAQGNPRILVVKLDVSHLDLELNLEVSRRISRCAFDHRLMRTNWHISATSCQQSCILKTLTHIRLRTLPNPDVAVHVKSPHVIPFEFAEKCHFRPLVALWSKASAHCFNVEQMHLTCQLS